MRSLRSLVLACLPGVAWGAGVSGSAYGFAKGVTPTGTTVTPSNNAQLTSYLADATPRVIVLTKTFDFTGTTTTGVGCRATDMCDGGQETIKDSCDSNEEQISVVYDTAGTSGMTVASNKALVGVGSSGGLRGKGLRLVEGTDNVIIQNIHIFDINPEYVWGGDGISLEGNDGVWIDHCTFDNIGRMFVVSHYTANRFTLSWNYFNGRTDYSSSCNGQQYWGTMFIGDGDMVTVDHNYYLAMSGRSPKIGGGSDPVYVHAYNNYFAYCYGHNFDITAGAYALLEGNRFVDVDTPMTSASSSSGAYIFDTPSSSSTSTCSSYIGRSCVVNALTDSGSWPSLANTNALSKFASSFSSYLVTPDAVGNVLGNVRDNSGSGHL